MRRKDREIVDNEYINSILDNCMVLHLAMIDGDSPYLVPLNFGYDYNEGTYTFYIHSAKVGKKIEVINKNNKVCIQLDSKTSLLTADKACDYSYYYQSIIANGKIYEIVDKQEKSYGLNRIMMQVTKKTFEFEEKGLNAVKVYKISIDTLSAKEHKSL